MTNGMLIVSTVAHILGITFMCYLNVKAEEEVAKAIYFFGAWYIIVNPLEGK